MPPQVPLQLENYFVESLTFQAKPGFDRSKPHSEQLDVKFSPLAHKEDPNRMMVRLDVAVAQRGSVNPPCELSLTLVGFFVLPDGLDEGMKSAMITLNAPSILYGVARQIVAETTGNGPWGKVFLPTFNFIDMTQKPLPSKASARAAAGVPVVSDKPAKARR